MSLKLDLDLARNGQIHPHVLPDGHDLVLLLRISGPNRQFVSLGTNVDHGAANLRWRRWIAYSSDCASAKLQ